MFKFVGWGLDGQKDEIHSFLTMYIMGGGVIGWRWVKTMIFPKRSDIKTAVLSITVLDHQTSDWAGTVWGNNMGKNQREIPHF